MLARYENAVKKHPILVNAATGAALCFLGDCGAQFGHQHAQNQRRKERGETPRPVELDLHRTAQFTVYGAFWAGPVNGPWFALLGRFWRAPRFSPMQQLAGKMTCQHALLNPLGYVPVFLGYWGMVRGHGDSR